MEKRSGTPDPETRPKVIVHDRRKVREVVQDEGTAGAEAGGAAGPAAGAAQEGKPAPGDESAERAALEKDLARAREEAAAYLDDLKRLKAEFDNYRKRILKEQTELVERASAGLAARTLRILDDFELAVRAAEEHRDFEQMLKGVELVYGELKELLAAEGVTPISARGKPFDPAVHEAAYEAPGDGGGEPYVAEVLRSGYMMKGRVLRPAMVKVARRTPGERAE